MKKKIQIALIMLTLVLMCVAVSADGKKIGSVKGQAISQKQSAVVTFDKITPGLMESINGKLKKQPGILSVKSNLKESNCEIVYDSAKINPQKILKIVKGFDSSANLKTTGKKIQKEKVTLGKAHVSQKTNKKKTTLSEKDVKETK